MQFLYRDGDDFHFMNTENYEQLHLSKETLGDSAEYLLPDGMIKVVTTQLVALPVVRRTSD